MASTASIELQPPFNDIETTRGLEDFSHLWLTFVFHRHVGKGWNVMVKPPRLDGKQRFGVFATRASFRQTLLACHWLNWTASNRTAPEC